MNIFSLFINGEKKPSKGGNRFTKPQKDRQNIRHVGKGDFKQGTNGQWYGRDEDGKWGGR